MFSRISRIVLGGACVALVAPMMAQEASAPISVETLVAEVLARHPEARFYEEELAVARGERRNAGTLANPELAVAAGRKRIADPIAREGDAWSVSVRQTFEWPGRLALRKAIANQQIKLAELGLEQFRVTLAARVRALALKLHAAREESAAAAEVAARFQALREVLVQREPTGLTPALELRIIEATELALRRRASEAAGEESAASLELNQLRGGEPGRALRLETPTFAFPAVPGVDALIAAALEGNFELQARRVEVEQQGMRVSLARTDRNATFSVAPYLSRERAGDRETQMGIEVAVPLPIWNKRSGDAQIAEARRRQAETVLRVAQLEIERQIAQQVARYAAKVAEMSAWRNDTVAQFKEAAALADRHYRLGAVPMVTYVELQKQYLDAVSAVLATRNEATEALQELRRLSGWNPSTPSAASSK